MTTPASFDPRLVALARAGRLNTLLATVTRGLDGDEAEPVVYRWAYVASMFGHRDADDLVAEFDEREPTWWGDHGDPVLAEIHLELALALLSGRRGLPPDEGRARAHLTEVIDHWLAAEAEEDEWNEWYAPENYPNLAAGCSPHAHAPTPPPRSPTGRPPTPALTPSADLSASTCSPSEEPPQTEFSLNVQRARQALLPAERPHFDRIWFETLNRTELPPRDLSWRL
ncbi:hypothetical protein [Subtercola sp. RTI3]|uniref:hypothetical protein n=1 Tax=Subtercola sp. RTI3 TaxID=3048639 RepID=UPI002B2377D4|nr:hypothetical protein [Subtercola sp. RTI3]MEA9985177.1 hypothetical protein [Subtercola sp. RTI3]